jgi:MoxR-like ATPase
MNGDSVTINGKFVQLSRPYHAAVNDFVGREWEMKSILVSWMAREGTLPLSPLLAGEPGNGKNRTVYEAAHICGKELYLVQGHEDVTAEDLMCAVRFSDVPGRKMDYILSPLATAMLRGMVFFIDGLGKLRKRALAPLESVLDERRYLDVNILGERIEAQAGFRLIAATNPSDLDDNVLPDFISSRVKPVIPFGYPSEEEINRILRSRYPTLAADSKPLLDCFWKLWREESGDRPPSPRDGEKIFAYAQSLADRENAAPGEVVLLEHAGAPSPIATKHVEEAVQVFQRSKKRSGR